MLDLVLHLKNTQIVILLFFESITWETKINSIINNIPSDISQLKYLKDINESIKAFKDINNIA